MVTKKKTARSVATQGAIVARDTRQTAQNAKANQNIKSAQGNTSNAYSSSPLSKDETRRKNISAAIKDAYNPNSNSHIAQVKRRSDAEGEKFIQAIATGTYKRPSQNPMSPKQKANARNQAGVNQTRDRANYGTGFNDARTQAALNQTRDRNKYGTGLKQSPLPSLDDYKTVFNGANKHIDNGKSRKENMRNGIESLLTGAVAGLKEYMGYDLAKSIAGKNKANEMIFGPVNRRRSDMGIGIPLTDQEQQLAQVMGDITAQNESKHPVSTRIGQFGGKAAQYAVLNTLLGGTSEGIANIIGASNPVSQNLVKGAIDYALTDLPLDTLPEVVENVNSGMAPGDVALNALKNAGVNYAANEIFGIPDMARDLIDYIPRRRLARQLIKENDALRAATKNVQPFGPKKPPYFQPPVDNADEIAEAVAKEVAPVAPTTPVAPQPAVDLNQPIPEDYSGGINNLVELLNQRRQIEAAQQALADAATEPVQAVAKEVVPEVANATKAVENTAVPKEYADIIEYANNASNRVDDLIKQLDGATKAKGKNKPTKAQIESLKQQLYNAKRVQEDALKKVQAVANGEGYEIKPSTMADYRKQVEMAPGAKERINRKSAEQIQAELKADEQPLSLERERGGYGPRHAQGTKAELPTVETVAKEIEQPKQTRKRRAPKAEEPAKAKELPTVESVAKDIEESKALKTAKNKVDTAKTKLDNAKAKVAEAKKTYTESQDWLRKHDVETDADDVEYRKMFKQHDKNVKAYEEAQANARKAKQEYDSAVAHRNAVERNAGKTNTSTNSGIKVVDVEPDAVVKESVDNSSKSASEMFDDLENAKKKLQSAQETMDNYIKQAGSLDDPRGTVKKSIQQKLESAKREYAKAEKALKDLGVNPDDALSGVDNVAKANVGKPRTKSKGKSKTMAAAKSDGGATLTATKEEMEKLTANNIADEAKTAKEGLVEPRGPKRKNSYSNKTVPEKTDMFKSEGGKEVLDHFAENPQLHKQLRNKDVHKKALDIIKNKSFDEAYNEFKGLLDDTDPVSVPLGYNLAKQAAKDGKTELAVDIVESMATKLTKQGQFTQAAAIEMLKDNPLAAQAYLQRQIKALNKTAKQKFGSKFKDLKLTADEIKAFANIENGDKEAITELVSQISDRLVKELPVTKWEKFVELRKMAMLLNPKTHIRNTVSNVALSPLASASDRVEAVYQRAYKAINKDFEVTQSLKGGGRDLKKQIADSNFFEDNMLPRLDRSSSNEYKDLASSSELMNRRQIFNDSAMGAKVKKIAVNVAGKTKTIEISDTLDKLTNGKLKKALEQIGNADEVLTDSVLENLKELDYWMLGALEDDPFVKKRFINRLASYLDAQGIKKFDLDNFTEQQLKVLDDAKEVAWQEALEATFKDDNKIVEAMMHSKKAMGKFGDIIMPFVKTPANIAARLIDYSPAGIVNAVSKAIKGAGADKVINKLAKGTTGTFMVGLGYLLTKNGIITGELSQDKDLNAFQKHQGKLPYSFEIGGKNYTFDWLQPAAGPLVLGAALAGATDKDVSKFERVRGGLEAVGNSWADLSPLQNVTKLFKTDNKGNVNIAGNVVDVLEETPLSLIPSVSGATARATDNVYRETYDKKGGNAKYLLNQALSRIPGASKLLPEQYDIWGNKRTRASSNGSNAFQQYIFPGSIGNDATKMLDADIEKLYKKTGDVKTLPHKAEWSYRQKNQTFDLTNEQHSKIQKEMGQMSYKLASDFLSSKEYKSLSDEQKVDILSKLYEIAEKSAVSNNIFQYEYDDDYKSLAKTSQGRQQIIDELIQKATFKEHNASTGSKHLQEAYSDGGEKALEQALSIDDAIKAHGYDVSTTYEFASSLPSLDDFEEYADFIDSNKMKNNAETRNWYSVGGTDALKIFKKADGNGGDKNGSLTKQELANTLIEMGYSLKEANNFLQEYYGSKIEAGKLKLWTEKNYKKK